MRHLPVVIGIASIATFASDVPAEDAEAYVQAMIDAVTDDIGWNQM